MKTKSVLMLTVIMSAICTISCGSSKQTIVSDYTPKAGSPFGEVYETPCSMYDDDDYFAATGIASGPATQKGIIQRTALSNGQDMIRQKMQHAYVGVVNTYFESIGSNKGTDVETQITGGGKQIIDRIVNDTSHSCLVWSSVDDKGNIECYIGVKVSKRKVANAIADNLSQSEKTEIRQHAEEFRRQMEEDLRAYRSE